MARCSFNLQTNIETILELIFYVYAQMYFTTIRLAVQWSPLQFSLSGFPRGNEIMTLQY